MIVILPVPLYDCNIKPSLHDCETSSMIVTLNEFFYDCEFLLLSFKFD